MEVKPGYKQTELGEIPKEWECHQLLTAIREMTDFVAAGSFEALRNNVRVFDVPKFALYVRLVDLRLGLGHNNQKYVDEASYKFLTKSNLFGNELLVANIGANVGEAFLMPTNLGAATIAPNMIIVRPNDQKVRYDFLYHYTSSDFGQALMRELIAGSGHPKINKTDLKKFKVLVPPLPEQRAIAEALSDVDALLGGLDRLVAKKRDLKKATMQQLLTGHTRLLGFSEEWETKRLGGFAAIRNQKVFPTDVDPGTLCVELEHISQGSGRLLNHSTAQHSTSSKYRFVPGDVLFGRLRPYLRKFWHADKAGICTTEIWPLMVDAKQASTGFLRALVETDRFIESASMSYGTHMPRADWAVIKNLDTRLPRVAEQEAIAAVLSDMDAEITALEARREKTLAVKQGMMQQLLTGRIRLVNSRQAEAAS